ncbi:MAG: glycoside hydrolase family 2 TIM barrel-domain containing protein [Coriobacteriia bacterium]|nr:glycoside hydrolase family 2 TIM barrel-domain containing protein [Coriobacteriia bacterium]
MWFCTHLTSARKGVLGCLAALALAVVLLAGGAGGNPAAPAATSDTLAAAAPQDAATRTLVSLNGTWSFTDPDEDAPRDVAVPHSWECMKSASNLNANIKTCTYERQLPVADYQGQALYLRFDGVNKIAVVKIDGETVGTHTGGFSAFYVDITAACAGKQQVDVAVEVTNISFDTMPVNSDFTHFAGIYRDVWLVAANPAASISNQDYGSSGVYLDTQVDLAAGSATLTPRVLVDYDATQAAGAATLRVETVLADAQGTAVGTSQTQITANGTSATAEQLQLPDIAVDQAHLWNGTVDPYLYTATVNLYVNDQLADTQVINVGFRTYEVREGRFYLNGQPYQLCGVGMHQEFGAATNATTAEQRAADIATVMEMGANALRTCHYPHSQLTYDLCDQYGIVVWAEIPFYLVYLDTADFRDNVTQCALEMVKQCRNHPSIIVWGMQNEVNYYESYQRFYPTQGNVEACGAFMRELAATMRQADGSRLIGEAEIDTLSFAEQTASWTTADSGINVVGLNLYKGWYGGGFSATRDNQVGLLRASLNDALSDYMAVFDASSGNTTSYVLTEYGAGANVAQHATLGEGFVWSDTSGAHPEEYQAYVHEAMMMAIYGDSINNIPANDRLWAAFAWSMYDFSSYRNEGGTTRLNTKGLISADRTTKKDAFYLYKANWNSTDLFTHICSSRYADRPSANTQVKVYSNCQDVHLVANGIDLGSGMLQQDGVFVWMDVSLNNHAANTVCAVGYNNGVQVCEDVCDSWGDACASNQYLDVDPTAWYHNRLDQATVGGLVKGYGDGTLFGPDDGLTRDQAAVILWRYLAPDQAVSYDASTEVNVTGLSDVADHAYYTGAANWAVAGGYIAGYEDGRFGPEDPLTTEQLCVILARIAGGAGDENVLEGLITDATDVSPWARSSCAWALASGVIAGCENPDGTRTLFPAEQLRRIRSTVIVQNAINNGLL